MKELVLSWSFCLSLLIGLSSQNGYEIDPSKDPEDSLRHSDFIRNTEHLKEHMTDMDFDPDKASQEELDFYFFKSHDTNGDNKLDGLELLQAITHGVDDQLDKLHDKRNTMKNTEEYRKQVYGHLPDNKLDGLELLQAINHAVEDQIEAYRGEGKDRKVYMEGVRKHLEAVVDKILKEDDKDDDGYINYIEFAQTRRASEMLQQIKGVNKN